MVIVEVLYPDVQVRTALALVYGRVEQVNVSVQGELVHRVDSTHVVQDEEQDGRSLGTRTVTLYNDNMATL